MRVRWRRLRPLIVVGFAVALVGEGFAESAQEALTKALHGTQASAVVLDLKTGLQLAVVGEPRRGTPGSTVKPLLLEYALEHGIVTTQTQVFCRRDLHIGRRALPCTHPAKENVFTAETALAESCNTYFAELGRRFSAQQLERVLRQTRLPHGSLEGATPEERELTVLGLQGVMASPLEMAQAYRQLAATLPADGPVAHGLAASVSYGMADAAAVQGMTILGKTGTASNPHESWTHGWFAGVLPGRLVVVVLVPKGDGGTAARLAQGFFQALQHAEIPR